MKLLAIDTSTKVAGAALMQDGVLVCEMNLVSGLTHSERLMPLVDSCLSLAQWEPAELDVIAAVSGPGSFTGIRIGVSTVKGMAEALGKPVVALNTLEVLAASFTGFGGVIVPILDARRGQVYCAVYDSELNELAAPGAMKLTQLLETPTINGALAVLFAGDGVAVHREVLQQMLGGKARFAPPHLVLQRAGAAAWLAWNKAVAGQTMNAADLVPEYLRKSSAEQVLESKMKEQELKETPQ
jgi:tRNA threonylcarbamoyladenosine biosynthesis protein TsaB